MGKQVKTIGLLVLLLAMIAMPFANAAAPTLTATCTFVGNTPASNGFVEENNTITITAQANYNLTNTTSLIFLGTNSSRGNAIINLTGNGSTMTARYLDVPDGTYNLGAEFVINNDTGNGYVSASTIACTNRSFNLETSEGLSPVVPLIIEQEKQEAQTSSIVLIIVIAGFALYMFMRKK